MELERHIETLLLANDCVIVPDFGGFMAHHIDARYDEADGAFIPPIRTLGFNPQLKINDSLLIHSYIEAYNVSYPEALQRVADDVSELKKRLYEGGTFELNNIGTLSINADGNIEFTPNEAGLLTPEYYGLSAFEMRPIKMETIEQLPLGPEVKVETEEQQPKEHVLAIDESQDDEAKTINIRVAWIRNAVAIAAAVLAFFLITTPVSNSVNPQLSLSTIQPVLGIDSTVPAKDVKEEPDTIKPDTTKTQPATDANTEATTAYYESQPAASPHYVVVLASQVSMSNAENFVKLLHQQGYKDARIYTRNNMNRVVYGYFQNESEAYQMVNKFRDHEEYEQAWVMKVES